MDEYVFKYQSTARISTELVDINIFFIETKSKQHRKINKNKQKPKAFRNPSWVPHQGNKNKLNL